MVRILLITSILTSCEGEIHPFSPSNRKPNVDTHSFNKIGDIPLPEGYERITTDDHSFGAWLRDRQLKKDNRVFMYDGSLKWDQTKHYAVIDMSVGKKNLQQCADAVIRLKAEFHYASNDYDQISFNATDGTNLRFNEWKQGKRFMLSGNQLREFHVQPGEKKDSILLKEFLEFVFTYAGTISLQSQLKPVIDHSTIAPGDVFIKAGSPGHAMIVADVAINQEGKKIFLLAQSYMPAQEMHIVKNPSRADLSPWFEFKPGEIIHTPDWDFGPGQLRTWKDL